MKNYRWFNILSMILAVVSLIGVAAIYIVAFWDKIRCRVEGVIESIRFRRFDKEE